MPLAGKVAVVAGAGGAVSRAVAAQLMRSGCRLALATPETADPAAMVRQLEREVGVHGLATAIPMDIQNEAQVGRLFRRVSEQLGGLEILVAGDCVVPNRRPLAESQVDEYERLTGNYLRATYLCSREALRLMIPRRRGHLIILSSDLALRTESHQGLTASARFGQRALAEVLAREARPYGIRVTGIYPGLVVEPTEENGGQAAGLRPEDVAAAVMFALEQPTHVRIDAMVLHAMAQELF